MWRMIFFMPCLWAVSGDAGRSQSEFQDNSISKLVADVRGEWEQRCKKLGSLKPKSAHGRWVRELVAVIRERVSKNDIHNYMMAVSADKSGVAGNLCYRTYAVQALIAILSEDGRRDELIRLLSRSFPDRVYYSDPEFWLACQVEKTLPDGITVLFDAFDISQDAQVRAKIGVSVARAFRAQGLDLGDDKKTIDACRSWYVRMKERIEPNLEYGHNRLNLSELYAKNGLFAEKKGGLEGVRRPP